MTIQNITLDLEILMRNLMIDLDFDDKTVNYCTTRLKSEGVHFLTKTLPELSKRVLLSLELGYFDRTDFTSFAWKNRTLRHFRNELDLIFDPYSGVVLQSPCAASIGKLRQLCEYCYKLALPYTKEQLENSRESFMNNERDLESVAGDPTIRKWADQLRKDFETYYKDISNATVSSVLCSYRPRSTNGTFNHGSSMYFLEREAISARQFPRGNRAYSGFYSSLPGLGVRDKKYRLQPIDEPANSELLFVPKDSRGPRSICREYRKRLETQMAFFDWTTAELNRISNGAINFQDQGVNRALAERGSVTRDYSTIDLKDASDRVSYEVVKTLFRNSPACRWFISGENRAAYVSIEGQHFLLRKLAGMGSGLTFPTMSLLISLTICREVANRTSERYEHIRRNVYVYGDDIVVPRKWYRYALQALHKIGLVPNEKKCFHNSHFRESCGGDYFKGTNVGPTRLKLSNCKPRVVFDRGFKILLQGAYAVKQLYEHATELYSKGLQRAASACLAALPVGLLVPGIDPLGVFFTDFRKGTDHISPDLPIEARTVRPQYLRSLDTRKFLTENGILERDPYRYLASKLRSGPSLNDNMDYPIETSFSELTIPRTLVVHNVTIPGWFIKR